MALTQGAAAQSGAAAPFRALPDVTVRSTPVQSPLDYAPAALTLVDGDKLRDRQRQVNLSESLSGTAGLLLQNRQNYAQDQQLSICGHGARSSFGVRGVQVFVDGIPATMPDGQGQANSDRPAIGRAHRGAARAVFHAVRQRLGRRHHSYTERGEGSPRVDGSFALAATGKSAWA